MSSSGMMVSLWCHHDVITKFRAGYWSPHDSWSSRSQIRVSYWIFS